jgi:hypothetical protein
MFENDLTLASSNINPNDDKKSNGGMVVPVTINM